MENFETTDPSALQSLLNGQQPSLIPESLATTLTVSFIVLNVLGILFFIVYVLGIIRKWKVQSAVLTMQKDLAEVKAYMKSNGAVSSPVNAPTPSPVEHTSSST